MRYHYRHHHLTLVKPGPRLSSSLSSVVELQHLDFQDQNFLFFDLAYSYSTHSNPESNEDGAYTTSHEGKSTQPLRESQ